MQSLRREDVREVEVQFHTFLTLKVDWGEWLISWYGHFTSGERAPGMS